MPVRRAGQLLFTLHVIFTLGVLVPAHRHDHRGASAAHSHDHDDPAGCHGVSGHHEREPAAPGPHGHHDASDCSVCLFVRALAAPPACASAIPTPDVVNVRATDAPAPVLFSSFVPTLHGRAPPAAA